jgi:hypothetical protein
LDKDAFDVYRLLQHPAGDLTRRMHKLLVDDRSAKVAEAARGFLEQLFGTPDELGSVMAGRYVEGVADPETVRRSAALLAQELLRSLNEA